ncbi:hypothetical protein [Steroidobacter sp.]|uniref:hypothetical protein n=1 Tax=Steroidobacter sp. TaxID=1978227 RepID=UPI001A63DA2D|nr:hypothetical protein [Steroidobacter sp.]MBL8267855.1 hypothetical protein [Steroidobacter sp.]
MWQRMYTLLAVALWGVAAASHAQVPVTVAQVPKPPTNLMTDSPNRRLPADGDKHVELQTLGLPRQLTVNGNDLLSRPVELLIDGKKVLSEGDVAETMTVEGEQTQFISNLTIDNPVRSKLMLEGAVEWDGLIRFSLSADSIPAQYRPAEIRYSIALPDSAVKFLHRPGVLGKRNVDLQRLTTLTAPYTPFLWLGNDDFGLFWLSEHAKGWRNAQQDGAITLRRAQGEWLLTINIQPQFQSDGSWHHEFALATTPVKALPQRWREWRLSPARGRNAYVIWPNEIGATYFGYPATNKLQTTTYLNRLRHGGVVGAPYLCPTWISTEAPEWQREKEHWATGVGDGTFKSNLWSGEFVHACTASETWQSFATKAFTDYIKANSLRAIYMDNAQIYRTKGCLGDGNEAEYPMLGQRSVYRSISTALRNNGSKTLSIVHSSGGINAFSFSSADALVNGEQYRGKVTSDYLDVATLTDFRVELNGAQWGLIPIFLPELPEAQIKEAGPSRKLMTLLLLHDSGVWPQWVNVQEVDRGLEQLDRFGIVDAQFVAYYRQSPLARVQGADILVSGYQRNDETLLIAGNLQKAAAQGSLCPADSLGPNAKLWSWPERESISLQNGCATIRVEAGSYRMYRVSR